MDENCEHKLKSEKPISSTIHYNNHVFLKLSTLLFLVMFEINLCTIRKFYDHQMEITTHERLQKVSNLFVINRQ